ncbi:MAG: hypothetical protein IJ634_06460 [Bacteroidales bacterium]|nr:hypothetical protein [Bacteroidales bacterium]
MNQSDTNIDTLKRLVCEAAGCQANTPGDFYTIMAFVESRTRESIGLTTIKRLWQYAGLSSTPRMATLDVLARSIGYRHYADFREHYGDSTPSSNIVLGQSVKASDLLPGDHLMLRWNPGREIVIEYLGNSTFRVATSEGSKLQADDTFQASLFALGHAAMLANVIHGERDRSGANVAKSYSSWPLYEIGQQGGLTLVRKM